MSFRSFLYASQALMVEYGLQTDAPVVQARPADVKQQNAQSMATIQGAFASRGVKLPGIGR